MAKFCGNCGSALTESSIFCSGCGTRVPAPAPPPVAQAPYTPPDTTPPPPPAFEPVQSFTDVQPFTPAPPAQPAPYTPTEQEPPPEPPAFAPVESYTSVPSFPPAPPAAPPAPYTPAVPEAPPAPPAFAPVESYAPVPSFTPAPTPPPSAAYPPAAPAPGTYQPVQTYAAAPPYAPAQPPYTPGQPPYTPGTAYPAAAGKQSNTLLKVIIAVVLFLFLIGALVLGGLWYAAQKIKAKAHAVAAQAMAGGATGGGLGDLLNGLGANSSREGATAFQGDPCRFLSKEEVSAAVGTVVLRVDAQDNGCNYIAKGDPADATSKHMSAMLGGMGVDAKTQKMIQKMAGGMFAQQEADDKSLASEAASGEIPVLVVSFTTGHAAAEMKMNRRAFKFVTGNGGGNASGDLDGIGDEAYVAGGSMIIFRKGNTAAHLLYISCPCNTNNVKPLASLIASRL